MTQMSVEEKIERARKYVSEFARSIIKHLRVIESLCRFVETYANTHNPFGLLERSEVKMIGKMAHNILVKTLDFLHELAEQYYIIMQETWGKMER